MLVSTTVRRRHARGFTLLELITTITVMAVLAGLAAPSFSTFIANQRARNASFDLMAALTLARSEAVTRNRNVTFVRATTSQAWDKGWQVVDPITPASPIQVQQALKNLSVTDSANLNSITYGKDGRILAANTTTFTIQPSSTVSGVSPRCVVIGLDGMPSSGQPNSSGSC